MFTQTIPILYCSILLLLSYQIHTATPSTNSTPKKDFFHLDQYKQLEHIAHAKYARSSADIRQKKSNDYYILAASLQPNMQKLIIDHHHKQLISMEYDPEQHNSIIQQFPYILNDLRSTKTYTVTIFNRELYDDIQSIRHILEAKQRIFNAYILCKTAYNQLLPQSPTTPLTPIPSTEMTQQHIDPNIPLQYITKSVFLFFNGTVFIPFKSSMPYDYRLAINPSAVQDTYRITKEELYKNLTIALEDAYQQPRTHNTIPTITSITFCIIKIRKNLAQYHEQLALDTQELLNQTDPSSNQLYARTSIALEYHKAQEKMHNRSIQELQDDLKVFTLDL